MRLRRTSKTKNQRPTEEICLKDGVQNAAQTLLANIRFSSVDDPIRIIAITSSIPNEGKTTVALSLAIAMSRSGSKCLIVEGDMRRRSMKTVLGARPRYGIHTLCTGGCTFTEAIVATKFDGVSFLDAEAGIPNPDGILSSNHFSQLLATLRKYFHYIIIDTPPVSAFADAAIIANKTDGTILVAREGYTDKRELAYAAEQLQAADANVLGVVMNAQKGGGGGGYGHYYGYYYEGYRDVPQRSAVVRSEDAEEAGGGAAASSAVSSGTGGRRSSRDSASDNQETERIHHRHASRKDRANLYEGTSMPSASERAADAKRFAESARRHIVEQSKILAPSRMSQETIGRMGDDVLEDAAVPEGKGLPDTEADAAGQGADV